MPRPAFTLLAVIDFCSRLNLERGEMVEADERDEPKAKAETEIGDQEAGNRSETILP